MSDRSSTLAEQIRRIVSEALYLELRDPNLEGITITRVRVSQDLQFADIRFTIQDDMRTPETVTRSLDRASGALKRALTKSLRLRRIPSLRFHHDEDVSAERRIGAILETLHIPPEEADDATS